MSICKPCATAADIRQGHFGGDWAMSASGELHSQCHGLTHCDCQHKGSGDRSKDRSIALLIAIYSDVPERPKYPSRCSVCYRRTALTRKGGVVHWHKNMADPRPQTPTQMLGKRRSYGRCPGSGKPDLVKAIASTVGS